MDKETLGKRLQDFFRKEIPITRSMGFSVAGWDGKHLVVAGRLSKNLNHKKNAFGGSLYSLATLAGWGMARLLADEAGMATHVVIQEGSLSYLKPVTKDFRAVVARPAAGEIAAFIDALKRKGRARLAIVCELREAGAAKETKPAAVFQGAFVAAAVSSSSAADDSDDDEDVEDDDE